MKVLIGLIATAGLVSGIAYGYQLLSYVNPPSSLWLLWGVTIVCQIVSVIGGSILRN